jgi:hypothetical protein
MRAPWLLLLSNGVLCSEIIHMPGNAAVTGKVKVARSSMSG